VLKPVHAQSLGVGGSGTSAVLMESRITCSLQHLCCAEWCRSTNGARRLRRQNTAVPGTRESGPRLRLSRNVGSGIVDVGDRRSRRMSPAARSTRGISVGKSPDGDGEPAPAPVADFRALAAEEGEVHHRNAVASVTAATWASSSAPARTTMKQNGRDRHRARHGNALRRAGRALEFLNPSTHQDSSRRAPCSPRENENLAGSPPPRVWMMCHARAVAQLHHCCVSERRREHERLAGDDGRDRGDADERLEHHARGEE